MLDLKDFMPINFLKKEKFTGSHKGMRFRMEKLDPETEGEDVRLLVTVWPEPYNYDSTEEEKKQKKVFGFDAQGIADGVNWLNEQYENGKFS